MSQRRQSMDKEFRMRHKKGLGIVFLLLLLGILSGCQFTPIIQIKIASASELNLDSEKSSLPVVLKIFQLTNADKFLKASFTDLWKREREVLGDSLVESKQMIVLPESHSELKLYRNSKTHFIGICAIFRSPDGNLFRVFKKVSKGIMPKTISISLRKSKVELS